MAYTQDMGDSKANEDKQAVGMHMVDTRPAEAVNLQQNQYQIADQMNPRLELYQEAEAPVEVGLAVRALMKILKGLPMNPWVVFDPLSSFFLSSSHPPKEETDFAWLRWQH